MPGVRATTGSLFPVRKKQSLTSPHLSPAIPTTASSVICECSSRAFSISVGNLFSPLLAMGAIVLSLTLRIVNLVRGRDWPMVLRILFPLSFNDLSHGTVFLVFDGISQTLDCFVNPELGNSAIYAHEAAATGTEGIASIKPETSVLDQKALNVILGPAGAAKVCPQQVSGFG